MADDTLVNVDYRIVRPDGTERIINSRGKVFRDDRGTPVRMVGTNQDITGRKQVEEQMRRLAAGYKAILDALPDLMFHLSRDGTLLDFRATDHSELAIPSNEIVGSNIKDRMPAEFTVQCLACIATTLDSGERQHWEYPLQVRGGVRDFEARMVASGQDEVVAIVRDITERKQEERLVRESREQLRNLAARLQEVREEERTGIAHEIHDELGQVLTGLKIDLSWLVERLPAGEAAPRDKVNQMIRIVDTSVRTVRDITSHLRPALLDDLGLEAAVEWFTNDFAKRAAMGCHLDLSAGEVELGPGRATAVFRILQEALTNVARHAAGHRVDVALRTAGPNLVLEVQDNGKGISDEALSAAGSLGLIGMRERAGTLGGQVDIQRRVEGGTSVTCTLPMQP